MSGTSGSAYRPTFSVQGDPADGLGIFDPSVVYPLGADASYLAYSVVEPDQGHVFTRLAISSDQGETGTYAGDVNAPSAMTFVTSDSTMCGASMCSGELVHEVPWLVLDPEDSPDRVFKVCLDRCSGDGRTWLSC